MDIQIGTHMFTPAALAQAIATIPAPPPGKKGAMVGTVDTSGAKVGLVFNMNDTWHIETAAQVNWDGDASVGAKIVATW